MLKILVVGKNPDGLADFTAELVKRADVRVTTAVSQQEALAVIAAERPQVVVADDVLADGPALPFIEAVVRRDPFINCALVSPLPADAFHEATEGLGVFMHLPERPGAGEAERMFRLLTAIGALAGGSQEGAGK